MPLSPVTPELAARLRATLPEAAFRPDTAPYREEPRGRHVGQVGLVVAPASTEEVAATLRACHAARVPVVPWGGGTGLVAGQVAPEGPAPVLLSLERMRAIRGVYPEEGAIEVEAGAILAEVQAAAEAAGRLFPLSLASEGSARIGGLLATNAGGTGVLRYGNARDLCLGLEAVLADGRVMGGMRRLRKDNTGYDLRHLLIGSEGTLGVITAASLRLFPRPGEEEAGLLVIPGPAEAIPLLALAQEESGGLVSGFELISGQGLRFLAETMPERRLPFASPPAWCVLLDLGGARGTGLPAVLERVVERAMEAGLVEDGVLARNAAQRAAFWAMREAIPEANRLVGAVASHDISVPIGAIAEFIARADAALAALGDMRVNCFGHVGDGNLHYNVFPAPGKRRSDYDGLRGQVSRVVHDLVAELGGSFSAEHGVGRLKVAELERYGDPVRLEAMRAIKRALDPEGILNPGAVLRAGQGG